MKRFSQYWNGLGPIVHTAYFLDFAENYPQQQQQQQQLLLLLLQTHPYNVPHAIHIQRTPSSPSLLILSNAHFMQGTVEREVVGSVLDEWGEALQHWESTPHKSIVSLVRRGVPEALRHQVCIAS